MRKWFRIRLILLGICVIGAAGLYAFYSEEPSFDGKRLSKWVFIVHYQKPGPEKETARAVVRQLASNSMPLLLRWLREPDSPTLNERIYNLKSAVIGWLVTHRVIRPRSVTLTGLDPNHRTIAGWALAELEPASKRKVIALLILWLGDKTHEPGQLSETAGSALVVLPELVPESIDPLIDALSNPDDQVSSLAVAALGSIGPNARKAIPALEKRLTDKDVHIRVCAADAIGKLGGDPNEFIPVIIQSLSEVKREELHFVLYTLLSYDEYAKPAIPVLLTILSNSPSSDITNTMVRNEITNALREIETQAAVQMPEK